MSSFQQNETEEVQLDPSRISMPSNSYRIFLRPFFRKTYFSVVFDLDRDPRPSVWNLLCGLDRHPFWARAFYMGTELPSADAEGILLTPNAMANDLRSITQNASTAYILLKCDIVPKPELEGEVELRRRLFAALIACPAFHGFSSFSDVFAFTPCQIVRCRTESRGASSPC